MGRHPSASICVGVLMYANLTFHSAVAATVYVSPTGNDSNAGLTWATAKRTVQDGLNAAVSGDQVWVAAGTYAQRITLKAGVGLYGGFSGTESELTQRNWIANVTILDGSRAGIVVTSPSGATDSTCIDGFTIRNGAAVSAGGICCNSSSPTISNNTITANSANTGGGVYCSFSSPTISHNFITGNVAGAGSGCGGAIYCSSSYPIIRNNAITGNSAVSGGGIYCNSSSPAISNNTITANSANRGGGLYCDNSASPITNNIFAYNSSGIYALGTEVPTLHNNCVYNRGGVNYSGIIAGTADFSLDPQLLASDYGDVHLKSGSPCIDAGLDSAVQPSWVDMDSEVRIQAYHVDIGADEFNGSTPSFTMRIVRVSPFGNDSSDGCSWASAKRTVQAAIDAGATAGAADVWVAVGTYYERITLKLGAHVYGGFAGTENSREQRDWMLNPTVLDGQAGGTVVMASSPGCATSTIDGFTIRNGTGTLSGSYRYGGGIYCSFSSLAISNNTITGSSAIFGGGVYCAYSSPTLSNDTISGNTGGGIYCSAGNAVISECQFTGNNSDTGGAISLYNTAATITGCTITGNRTNSYRGGGLYAQGGSPTVADCQMDNNVSVGDGGGMELHSCTSTITDCSFSRNRASGNGGGVYLSEGNVTLIRCHIDHNRSDGYGGGVILNSGTFLLRECSILENTVWRDAGGVMVSAGDAILVNCLIARNACGCYGGGLRFEDSGSKALKLVNCTLSENMAAYGGGVSYGGSGGSITNCILWGNDAVAGPAIHVKSGSLAIGYSDVEGGSAAAFREGPATLDWALDNISADPMLVFDTDLHLMPGSPCIDAGTNTPPIDPPAGDYEGAARPQDGDLDGTGTVDMGAYEFAPGDPVIAMNTSTLTLRMQANAPGVEKSLVIRNRGGGVLHWQATANVPWLTVTPSSGSSQGDVHNLLARADASTLGAGTYSGLITIRESLGTSATIRVSLLIGRTLRVPSEFAKIQEAINASAEGDLVLVANGTYTGTGNKDLDFNGKNIIVRGEHGRDNCLIDCQQQGSGFHFHSAETSDAVVEGVSIRDATSSGIQCSNASCPTIRNCAIRNCTASHLGGGILCSASDPLIQGCLIDGCQVKAEPPYGGGICAWVSSSPSIVDCTITNNSALAHSYGGGISFRVGSRAVVKNCTLSGNLAMNGGALSLEGENRVQVIGCLIESNTASYGAGVYCYYNASPILLDCTLRANIASSIYSQGMGIYAENSRVTVRGSRISNHVGQYWGGAVYQTGGALDFSNCLIDGNSAKSGGGISLSGTCSILNCTFVRNSATTSYGGGLMLNGTGSVANCVFWQNAAPYGPSVSLGDSSNSLTITYTDVPPSGIYVPSGSVVTYGAGNINADPRFVDADAADLHLSRLSPCIDAGDPASDYSLEPQPNGSRINMGAYGNTSEAETSGWLIIEGYTPISRTLVSGSSFDYQFALKLRSIAATSVNSIVATLAAVPAAVQIVQGVVNVPAIPAGGSVSTQQTFTIRVDESTPASSIPVRWELAYAADTPCTQTITGLLDLASVPLPGDFNADDAVDASDLLIFVACATGPGVPYDAANLPSGCIFAGAPVPTSPIPADYDADGDVDGADFAVLQRCFSGEDNAGDPNCAG